MLEYCAVPRLGLIVAVLLAFSTLSLSGQDKSTCNFVIKKVWFESASGLTSEQLQKLHNLVEGRCYDPAEPSSISNAVFDQLRQWGYRKAKVYDPDKFRVVDQSVHPSLIALVVDFQVNDLTACPAVEPRDAGYEDAMALREVLERNGIEVWCVGRSKMAHVFEGQLDAALFVTAQGRFEALFFPPEEELENLLITSDYHEGWYAYTFAGTPRWQPENQTLTMKRPDYFVRSRSRLFMTGNEELAARLESILGPVGSESRSVKSP